MHKIAKNQNAAVIVSPRIGDTIFCTPAIHILKNNLNPGKLYVIASSEPSAEVFKNNPDISAVYISPNGETIREIADKIDAVIDFHNNKDTQEYLKKLGKPYYVSPRFKTGVHQSKVATDFVSSLFPDNSNECKLGYRLFPQSKDAENVRELLTKKGAAFDNSQILIGCHMGTYNFARRNLMFWKRKKLSKKVWPFENYLTLGKMLFDYDKRIRLVLTGTKGEKRLVKYFAGYEQNIIDMIGETSVLELKAMIDFLKLFITPDTGPLHIATTTKVPLVYICCHATDPLHTGPYPLQIWHRIARRETMELISPKEVFDIAVDIISR